MTAKDDDLLENGVIIGDRLRRDGRCECEREQEAWKDQPTVGKSHVVLTNGGVTMESSHSFPTPHPGWFSHLDYRANAVSALPVGMRALLGRTLRKPDFR